MSFDRVLQARRIDSFSQWWELPAVVIAVVAILALVFWIYRRDSVELSRGAGIGLALLRGSALGCLVAAYLDFERTTEHELVFPSRVAVLVDSSASMTIEDEPPENVDSVSLPASRMNRCEHAINVLESGDFSKRSQRHTKSRYGGLMLTPSRLLFFRLIPLHPPFPMASTTVSNLQTLS